MFFVACIGSKTCSPVPPATVECPYSKEAARAVRQGGHRLTFAASLWLRAPASGTNLIHCVAPQMTRDRLLGASPLALQQLASAAQPGSSDALTPCSRKVAGPEAASCSKGAQRWLSCSLTLMRTLDDKRACAGCTVTGAAHFSTGYHCVLVACPVCSGWVVLVTLSMGCASDAARGSVLPPWLTGWGLLTRSEQCHLQPAGTSRNEIV